MSQRSSHTHLQAATSPPPNQSLQKSVPAPPKKNFKFFSHPSKKLNHPAHKPTMPTAYTIGHDIWTTEREAHAHNSTYPKGGVSCSKDSFVVNQTLVFQIKFCGVIPALRVAAKR